jgi:predicted HicB family RNase H-like nuclease
MATFSIRLPDDLHAAASKLASEEDRSLNNWIVQIIKRAISKPARKKETDR